MPPYGTLDDILRKLMKFCKRCGYPMYVVRIYARKENGGRYLKLEPLVKCIKCGCYDRGNVIRVSADKWLPVFRKYLTERMFILAE